MSARTERIALGMVLLFVLGLVALYVLNSPLLERSPKTWIVQRGETLRVPADEVLPEDRWECPGKGGSTGTPPPGHGVSGSLGFSMSVDMEGNVTAYCEPGPPGNV